MNAAKLLADAKACRTCGKEHPCRDNSLNRGRGAVTWADPTDGHPYRPPVISRAWLEDWVARHTAPRKESDHG